MKSKKRLRKILKSQVKDKPDRIQKEFIQTLRGQLPWTSIRREDQTPPSWNWFIWYLRCGRGWGKTRTIAEWLHQRAYEKKRKMAIVGETPGDVREDVILGEGGLFECNPGFNVDRIDYQPSKRRIIWPNGSKAIIYSGANPEQPRGFSGDTAICDEIAAWDYPEDTLDNLMFGMREGVDPRIVIASTPKPLDFLQRLEEQEHTAVTTGSSYENKRNLAEKYYETTISKYEGTSFGKQEIYAEYLEEMGVFWNWEIIERARREGTIPDMNRVVVSIDPAVKSNEDSDETGIVVVGKGRDERYYVLEDLTMKSRPSGWASHATNAYSRYKADCIVGEVNNGGDMVESVIRGADDTVAYKEVRASRGKEIRAQPISASYERGEVTHKKQFDELEKQMVDFNGEDMDDSPDRVDALVWGISYLMSDSKSSFFY